MRTVSPDWPGGYDRIILAETDSTLDEAHRRAPSANGPVWILALSQTAARGRRGRPWRMPPGNFAATLLLEDKTNSNHAALRSYAAALALYDTFQRVTGRHDNLALKWPNDVLFNGGKIAGILLEGVRHRQDFVGLSIGIGVNLAAAPDASEVEARALPPVCLTGETGITVSPEDFLDALAPIYAEYERQLIVYGFAPIREAWLARATRLGEVITARLPNEEITGVFETVDENGYLVLQTSQGRRTLAAADIFF